MYVYFKITYAMLLSIMYSDETCLCVFVSEESLHKAAYFRAISQTSKLAVDLVQLTKPHENEDPNTPVLRTMEEIKKFEAEAILLFIDKENVELMLQQVISFVFYPN